MQINEDLKSVICGFEALAKINCNMHLLQLNGNHNERNLTSKLAGQLSAHQGKLREAFNQRFAHLLKDEKVDFFGVMLSLIGSLPLSGDAQSQSDTESKKRVNDCDFCGQGVYGVKGFDSSVNLSVDRRVEALRDSIHLLGYVDINGTESADIGSTLSGLLDAERDSVAKDVKNRFERAITFGSRCSCGGVGGQLRACFKILGADDLNQFTPFVSRFDD